MKGFKLERSKIKKYLFFALLIVTSIYVLVVRQWPFYVLLLTYLVYFLTLGAIYYSSVVGMIGNYLYATGKTEKAIKVLKKSIDMKTKSPTAHLNYAIHLVRHGQPEEAMEMLQKAQTLKPAILTDKNIMLTMGSCYWGMGRIDDAIEILEKMRVKFDYVNAHVLTTLGYMYFLKDDMEKALDFTQKAIDDNPELGSAWDNMGQIYYKMGDAEQAKESFLKALEYKKSLVDSHYYLGVIFEEENDDEKARQYFTEAAGCEISALNTVSKGQLKEKCDKYGIEYEIA